MIQTKEEMRGHMFSVITNDSERMLKRFLSSKTLKYFPNHFRINITSTLLASYSKLTIETLGFKSTRSHKILKFIQMLQTERMPMTKHMLFG